MADVKLAALVPVAGKSRRMGAFKPLMRLGEMTVIERTVLSLLDAGAETVSVVTGHRAREVEDVLGRRFGGRVVLVRNERFAETDMLESIRAGCRALPPCDAFFLLPGDMPAVRPETFSALRSAWEGRGGVVFPILDGKRSHPPLITYGLVEEIIAYPGNDGLRGFWATCPDLAREVAVDDLGTQIDLDYPRDYARCKELLGVDGGRASAHDEAVIKT